MKKVLLLVMVLCLGLGGIPAKAEVFYEVWDAIPPNVDGLGLTVPGFHITSLGTPTETGTLPNFSDGPRDNTDVFTFRQTAHLLVPATASYTFYVDSDDGSIVFIDGVRVAANDGWHGTNGGLTDGPVALMAGTYLIEVQMFEDGGGDALIVEVESVELGLPRGPIPDEYLSLPLIPETPMTGEIDVALSGAGLEWTNPLGASQFNVYFSTALGAIDPNNKNAVIAATVDGTSISIDDLAGGDLVNDTRYFFRVDTIAEPNNVLGIIFAFDSMRMVPIITVDPANEAVGPGGCLAALSVTAISGINDDGGDLSYQWYDGSGAIDGEMGDTLVSDAEGTYYCVVSSSWGEATSASAALTIVGFGLPAASLADGLLGYWSFDVDGTDDSGEGLTVTPNGTGVNISPGLFGNALDLNGAGGSMRSGKNASALGIGGNAARSVSVWAYVRRWDGTQGGLYDLGNRATGENFSLRTLDSTEGRWRIQYWGGDYDFTYGGVNQWIHFVHTHNGTTTKIYADGVEIVTWAKTINTTDNMDWRIGIYGDNQSIDGMVDDVALWNRELTAEEVAAIYSAGQAGGTLAGASWAPLNPQYSPELNASGWFDPNVDLTLSWEKALLGPCGDGVTYNVIWTRDLEVAKDPNAVPYVTGTDMMATISAADLNYEDEFYVRVDVSYDGDSTMGEIWQAKAIKLVPDIVSQPQASGLLLLGETATFSVETGSDTPVAYEWFLEADGDDVSLGTGVTDGNINTITIVGVGIAEDGMVYCIATNDSGPKQTDSARLEIGRLIGHWTMDAMEETVDGEGAAIGIAVDSSPFGRDGIVMGDPNLPKVVAGKIGSAIEFNPDTENGQWIDTGLKASELGIGGGHAKSVSAWVYTTGFNDGGIWDLGARASGQNFSLRTINGEDQRWRIQYWGGDYDFRTDAMDMHQGLYDAPESWNTARPDPVEFSSINTWVHFVLAYGDGVTKVYANGRIIAIFNRGLNTGEAMTFRIAGYGNNENPPSSYFKGLIDDVRLYNYALSSTEAAQLYLDVEGGDICPEDPVYDFNGDCETNMVDFAMFMLDWMDCNLLPCN